MIFDSSPEVLVPTVTTGFFSPRGAHWCVMAISICLWSTAGLAQSDADRATARALAAEGFQALQGGDYETAEDRFRRADALVHAPTLVLDRGRALMGLGHFVEAQEQFELVLREGVSPNAPASWKRALEDAAILLEQVEPKVAWLTITVPGVSQPEISIDGQKLPSAAQGVRRATNPGTRTIDVSASGYAPRRMRLDLPEGGAESIEVSLERLPEKKTPRPPRREPSPEPDEQPKDLVPYVALGVGGLGIAVGSVAGALALKKHAKLTDVCPSGTCPMDQQPAIDQYHRLSWVSGVGFVVGIAGAATGTVLLVKEMRADSARSSRARLELFAAPGHTGLRGTFQ